MFAIFHLIKIIIPHYMYISRCLTLLFALFVTLLGTSGLFGNNQDGNTPEECEQLITKGNEAINKRDLPKALEYFIKAEGMAEKMQWKDKLVPIKTGLGITHSLLSNFGDALGYYQQALEIAEASANDKDIARVLTNLGLVYAEERDYDTALRYYQRAYLLVNSKNAKDNKIGLAINISDVYNILGDYKQARKYLEEVRGLPKSEGYEQIWQVNYAESYMIEGDFATAQKMMEDLVPKVDSQNDGNCYVCVTELLSKIYSKQNKTDLAIHFAGVGLKSTLEMVDKVRLYGQLSKLHLQKGQCDIAIKYKDSAAAAKDSMAVRINRGLFESNKVKMNVQEYQNQLDINQQKQQTQRNFFIGIIIVSLVVSLSIYRGLKSKIFRQNQDKLITRLELEKKNKEQLIIEKELENTKSNSLLNQELLKNSIAEKNRELSAKALYLSIRNELIENTINSLTAMPEVAKNAAVSDHIKVLTRHLKSDADWEDFITQFENTNPALIKILKRKHPDLNAKDIRFICCIFMNLDTKEIGNIFSITYDAAHKRKHRIMEKMHIVDTSLYEYLVKLDFDLGNASAGQDMI